MNLDKLHRVYFVGIGGIGMSALARYFKSKGLEVFGYDRVETTLTRKLESLGISITYKDDITEISNDFVNADRAGALVVFTPAIPISNKILRHLKSEDYEVLKRSQVLEVITTNTKTIAVAGTHGKTTTSSMIAHMLNQGGIKCNAFLGGIAANFDSNVVLHEDAEYTVVEADEFDRSFLRLNPTIGVVTSVDADHLDIYETDMAVIAAFEEFANKVVPDGLVMIRKGIEMQTRARQISYGLNSKDLDLSAENVEIESGNYAFEIFESGKKIGKIASPYPGFHNVENALVAIRIGMELGLTWDKIAAGIGSFKGVKRRFEMVIKRENRVFIDDYAHHPTEIDACVGSVKALYPNKKITGVFQPHLYSRTRDFADGFAKSLSGLNQLVLMDIYPAREEPIPGVDSKALLDKVSIVDKKLCEREDLIDEVLRLNPEVLVTMGAGDIDKMVEPLKLALNAKDE